MPSAWLAQIPESKKFQCCSCDSFKTGKSFRRVRADGSDGTCTRCANDSALPMIKVRNCLRCGRQFKSRNFGHRVCRGCKEAPAWKDLAVPDLQIVR